MRKTNNFIKTAILAVLLLILVNPGLNPLLGEGAKNATAAELERNFGLILGGNAGIFSPAKLITALAVAIFVWLLTTIICIVLEKTTAKGKRTRTVASLLISVVKTVGAVLALIWVLNVMGVNLGAIFASLGIVSLIVGFGVQSLIEDCVTGIFIILEGQYNIGDIILIGDFRGTVKSINMRTTTLVDGGGNLKVINNSDIRNIQNRSQNDSFAVCTVGISYDCDLPEVERVLAENLPKIYEEHKDIFEACPSYGGVAALSASSVDIRITAKVKESNIFSAQRLLNREIFLLFNEYNIEIPFSQVVVHNAK